MSFSIAELERQTANMFRWGTVVALDTAKRAVTVDIGELKTDFLPWMWSRCGDNDEWDAPEPGDQVVVCSPHGDLAQGFVLPGFPQDDKGATGLSADVHRRTYKDGAIVEYDRGEHAYTVEVPAIGSITISLGPAVSLTMTPTGVKIVAPTVVVQSPAVTIDAAATTITGAVEISGPVVMQAGLAVAGDVVAIPPPPLLPISLATHLHAHTMPDPDPTHLSGPPWPPGVPVPA